MKFLKAKAAASRVLVGRDSELTILSRFNEYWGFAASCFKADSAGVCLLATRAAGQPEDEDYTFAMLGRIEGCIKQLGDVTNIGHCENGRWKTMKESWRKQKSKA